MTTGRVVVHFTHVDHLATIVSRGLVSDAAAQAEGLVTREVGNRAIKDRRRRATVPVGPGGVVADYVPFYFAPRSPMMFSIHKGNVTEYDGGIEALVYLVSSVERLTDLGLPIVITDRNAVLPYAAFFEGTDGLVHVDWELMEAKMWTNTIDEPDRMERRMAECLVHQAVPWEAVEAVCVRSAPRKAAVEATLAATGDASTVRITPDWYF